MIGPDPTPDDAPTLLELPPNHGSRLKRITRDLVAALCHVDRMFRPHRYNDTWWLRLREPDGPMVLVAPDYYLFRRVLAMEELEAILEDADAESEPEEEADVWPLFVWGDLVDSGSIGPKN
jgi:hypothetical protein